LAKRSFLGFFFGGCLDGGGLLRNGSFVGPDEYFIRTSSAGIYITKF
jgi:hypothetical protein